MTIPRMVSIRDAADQTGLSYRFIRKLCEENKIVYITTGTKFLINLDKFVDYLNGKQEGVQIEDDLRVIAGRQREPNHTA